MSKLTTILQELKADKGVFIAPIDEWPPVVHPNGSYNLTNSYSVDICVAPTVGIYLPDELNRFMEGLISVEPDHKHPFSLWRDFEPARGWEFKHTYRLGLGYMLFIEKIGQKRIDGMTVKLFASRNLEIDDIEKLIKEVMPDGGPGEDVNLYRHIMLRIYPNIEIAKKKFGKNDLGAEMTQYHLQSFVPDISEVYRLFEETYTRRKDDTRPMQEVRSNLGTISRVRVQ